MRTGVRHVQKLNQKDPEAAPIVVAEVFDLDTGERISSGWTREPSRPPKTYPDFTIPALDHPAIGANPCFTDTRPGRYFVPSLEGKTQSTTETVRELQEAGVLEVVAA